MREPRAPYRWLDVPAKQGELVVILGDYLSALSHGKFASPVHRVLLPPPGQERFSFTYFRYPNCGATVPERAAKNAEARAAASARRRGRHPTGGGAFNTLVRPQPEGAGLSTLASRPFGELLLDKWRGVASNKAA